LAAKCGCMYADGIINNMVLEQVEAKKLRFEKFRSKEKFEVKDYFQQLRRARKIRDVTKTSLNRLHLIDDIFFVKSD